MSPARRHSRPVSQTPTIGCATAAGTARYAERFADRFANGYFRPLGTDGLCVSSIGLGTYLGQCDDADDERYVDVAHLALGSGVNLLDTAVNYRCQRSERTLGRALLRALRGGTISRDEVVVCTKGGYIPLDGTPPDTREAYRAYLTREYYDRGIMTPDDVVAGAHCLAPAYLAAELARSRENLQLDTIDVYYVHNPEQQLEVLPRADVMQRLRAAFEMLEHTCEQGEIGVYGCATWNGFRVAPDARDHLELADLVALAREIGGDAHHFRVVQLPVNLALTEAVRAPTQQVNGKLVPFLEAAAAFGITVMASASLLQSKLASHLPAQVQNALPGHSSDAQRAIAFVRSLPVVTTALVGMRSAKHLNENLGAGKKVRGGDGRAKE
ncbi:MAG TPA: aldo/keto reductase [Gemmatimonadaceae bacterium]|nr:aldo/keto reductase [Gemmatimonadaceae bacterium]